MFILSMGACGNLGGCGACGASAPLPAGGLPGNQTIEGGAQVRVTPSGFAKLTSILPGLLNSQLTANPLHIGSGSAGVSIIGFDVATAHYCEPSGCNIFLGLNAGGLSTSVVNGKLRVGLSANLDTTVHLRFVFLGATVDSCDMHITSNNIGGSFDVAMGVKPTNGELDIHLASINAFSLGLNFDSCGIISDIGNLISNIVDAIVPAISGLLTPLIDPLIQSFLPNPLGIASMTDVGSLLAGVSPGTEALMETRMVPGGYVSLDNVANGGMSMGVITGLNSDEDPMTRTGIRPDNVPYVSEPSRCVPPLPAPDFSQVPLPTVARSALTNPAAAFTLLPAGQFSGNPDPMADLAMGISETTLDLAGHHLVTSGALCLGVGTSFINQLNVGTISILVPSLGDLQSDKGNDPLLLVTRPQRAVDFTIGDNTMMSPAITLGISHMEVDFYAFLYERYVRAFTLDLTMNVGVNLEFSQAPGGPAMIKPTLVGISSQSVTVKVLNSDFVKETPQHLEMVLPSVFDLVTPLLGNLQPIQVPSFAGFSLSNLSIQHVTTSQDDFLALYASLGAGFQARQLAQTDRFAADAVRALDASMPGAAAPSTGHARLRGVNTPDAATIRGALLQEKDGQLPAITFDVDRFDDRGRELEWSWNFNGGLWRPFQSVTGPLVISDRAFAWQGKYTIGLQSRVKGDYRTTSDVIETPVVIDSVGPKVFADKAEWKDDQMIVPVWDVVSGKDVQVAYGHPGSDKPLTDWVYQGDATLAKKTFDELQANGEVAVFAKDELGNTTIELVAPFHGQAGGAGCACQTSGGPGAGGLALFGIVGFLVVRRRRRISPRAMKMACTFGIWIGASVAMSLQPGCSCSHKGGSCETVADCSECPKGQLPFCIDNECVCSDDIPLGHVGPYSDVAAGPDGTIWVSAYAQSHGDLVVAQATGGRIPDESWEWVDGVPDGPVVVPDSKIRNGIADDGADVGMYTSIAVGPDGTPMVTYFDVDRGALKFAARVAGTWQITDIDIGTGGIDNVGGSVVGMYTSLSLRSDDGRPGVAYLAHTHDANGEHAEVRYASAQTTMPTGPGDWQTWVVDTGDVPPADPANPNIYPLPEGLGLFIDSTRNPANQAPVVAYYDRGTGDLKVSKFNVTSGTFGAPIILDGSGNIDAGWSPSIQVDAAGKVNVAYVSATTDDLKYVVEGGQPEVIDDGYRIVGTTVDGLPKPEFHFVGDDAGLVLPSSGGPMVVYQDATTQELLLAQRQPMGGWSRISVAGATQPWPGAYGFFAADTLRPQDIVMSSWVIDQPTGENWVEVFTKPTIIQ